MVTLKSMTMISKVGDALIFDELGFHRGSAPTLNDRLVIRFLEVEKIEMFLK